MVNALMYWISICHYLQGRSSQLSSRQHQLDGRLLQSIAVPTCTPESLLVPVDVALALDFWIHCIVDYLDNVL